MFAEHNLVKDPPFSRLDLVSCRNLLIYFGGALQQQALELFHQALRPEGWLLLGTSETIGERGDLFALKDAHTKLYQKKSSDHPYALYQAARPLVHPPADTPLPRGIPATPVYDLDRAAEQRLHQHYVPPAVIVGSNQGVLRFLGRAWPYLEPATGAATLNLFKLAHPDLSAPLRAAIAEARKTGEPVRRDAARLRLEDGEHWVGLQILPLAGPVRGEEPMLVVFEPAPPPAAESAGASEDPGTPAAASRARIDALERELSSTRAALETIIEDQDAVNETLQALTEESRSSNEELQTTNEELQTAKEELQASNEELSSLNDELEVRNEALVQANDDLTNLLVSAELPVVMLSAELRVRRFTRAAAPLLGLIETDIGRPIGDLRSSPLLPDLQARVRQVIEQMMPQAFEAQDPGGRWYSVRLHPYKTRDRRVEGAVITFVDIDEAKGAERLRQALAEERRLATVVRDSRDAVTVQDLEGTIRAWNPAAERLYGYSEAEALGMSVRELVAEPDRAALQALLDDVRAGRPVPPPRTDAPHQGRQSAHHLDGGESAGGRRWPGGGGRDHRAARLST